MRRGHHTSRVLKALGTPDPDHSDKASFPDKPDADEILPNEFTE
jgi:acetolactate synthase-1/3 small subunit